MIGFNRQNATILLACFFIFFNQFSQYWVTGAADLDQSEQLLFSQHWSLGYGAQPPLYTYIVNTIFFFTGESLLALMILKAFLLSALMLVVSGIATQLRFTSVQHFVAVASFVFIPQFVWESQRDLSHSPMVALLSASLVYVLVAIKNHTSRKLFVAVGLLAALILLTKYSAVLVLISLLLSSLLIKEYRKKIYHTPNLFIALAVFTIIILPHGIWMLSNTEVASGSLYKLKIDGYSPWTGLVDSVIALIAFLTPLWIFALIILDFRGIRRTVATFTTDHKFLMTNLIVSLLVVFVFVLLSGTQEIKDRWYQPLMVTFPLFLALFAKDFSTKGVKVYIGLVLLFMGLISFALPARTILADSLDKYSRPNFPLIDLGKRINEDASKTVILVDDRLIGGNLVLSSNGRIIIAPENIHLESTTHVNSALVVCKSEKCSDHGISKLLTHFNLNLDEQTLLVYQSPYRYSDKETYRLYVYTAVNEI